MVQAILGTAAGPPGSKLRSRLPFGPPYPEVWHRELSIWGLPCSLPSMLMVCSASLASSAPSHEETYYLHTSAEPSLPGKADVVSARGIASALTTKAGRGGE